MIFITTIITIDSLDNIGKECIESYGVLDLMKHLVDICESMVKKHKPIPIKRFIVSTIVLKRPAQNVRVDLVDCETFSKLKSNLLSWFDTLRAEEKKQFEPESDLTIEKRLIQ